MSATATTTTPATVARMTTALSPMTATAFMTTKVRATFTMTVNNDDHCSIHKNSIKGDAMSTFNFNDNSDDWDNSDNNNSSTGNNYNIENGDLS